MTAPHAQSVVILGGGLAGLTAAHRLASQGHRVTVVDQPTPLEGTTTGGQPHDEPESFTLLGCHHDTQALLRSLQANSPQPVPIDIPLEFRLPDHALIRYPRTRLPAPLHTWVSLLRFTGLPWNERWQLASWLERLWEGDELLSADLEQRTADEWLATLGQSTQTCRVVWNPLAQWLTGNDLCTLSAEAFVNSVRPLFLNTRSDSRILILQNSPQTCLVHPIIQALTKAGATILRKTEAIELRHERDRISGVLLKDGSLLQADWYITALSPQQLTPLIPERWLTRYAYFQQLTLLQSSDSTTILAETEQPCASPRLILLGDTVFHSVLATRSGPDRTSFSLVTTDSRFAQAQLSQDLESLIPDLLRSLGLLRPGSRIATTRRRTIPHAVLSLRPGTKPHRPIQRSPIANLLVAGAWTDTGWPPNLESAIVSGNRSADAIGLR
ncbi:MAG: FAD-dependent oxidoreductase [Nitrospirae bacterium]|nr:FAD-dependent oxidoreductase [Nitrospirota bacterium]